MAAEAAKVTANDAINKNTDNKNNLVFMIPILSLLKYFYFIGVPLYDTSPLFLYFFPVFLSEISFDFSMCQKNYSAKIEKYNWQVRYETH